MLKNYISFALLFAICWSVDAEAVMGMSASKALSYNNTVSGAVSSHSSNKSTVKPVVVKKEEKNSATYTITMNDKDPSKIETKHQTVDKQDYINVILPSFSWSVDPGTCEETHTVTNTRVSFKILGTRTFESSCEIKLYGYDAETSQMLNKVIALTVN